MEKQYLPIMVQSLEKKIGILDQIIEKNKEQTEILNDPDMKWDDFDANANQKMNLIDEMEKLDDGFEELFARVKEELQSPGGKTKYAQVIVQMQGLIQQITERSVSIQAQEARNKALVEQYFRHTREIIRKGRTSSRAAMDYYKNMSQTSFASPFFLDSKK
ncbi:MAG: flagellar export chaperone FlgN [Lachnospiraceae bacterium]|nr:flagellar export chaperone FlgN [Lachnospiraceae bacterium]